MNRTQPPVAPSTASRVAGALVIGYLAAVFAAFLFATEGVFERDGFFHARYSATLLSRGLSRSFPWLYWSHWREHFSDKDFLYHVLLAPFCSAAPEPLGGAKVATLLLACAILGALFVVLERRGAPVPSLFAALAASGGGLFLSRLLMVRSHVLSILLTIVGFELLLAGRAGPCFLLGFLYAWSYSFPLSILMTSLAMAMGQWWCRRPGTAVPRHPLAVGAGIATGLVLHPYTPGTMRDILVLLDIVGTGVSGGRATIGTEFIAPGIVLVLLDMPLALLALLATVVAAAMLAAKRLPGRTLGADTGAALSAACGWLAGTLVFARLAEYFVPMVALASGLVARDCLPAPSPRHAAPAQGRTGRLLALLAGVSLVGLGHWWSLQQLRGAVRAEIPRYGSEASWRHGRMFEGAAAWMRANLAPGSVVVNLHWDDFPELYDADRDRYYVWGIDPTYLRRAYPEKWALLQGMVDQTIPLDLARLGAAFDARYMIVSRYRFMRHPGLAPLRSGAAYADASAVVLPLRASVGKAGPPRPDAAPP